MWAAYIDKLITRQHIGIVMTIIGTIILALSTKIIPQKSSVFTMVSDGKVIRPNETFIDKDLFWLGLEFIALGAFLQW